MMKTIFRILNILALALPAFPAMAQEAIGFEEFLSLVAEKNTGYLAEKYNVGIAEANVQAAKVFNDPELSVGYSNNQDWNLRMGQSLETGLSYSMSLGNVRGARIKAAKTEMSVTEEAVADYFRNLKAEASMAYATAWAASRKAGIFREAYENMSRVASGDSLRLAAGDINVTDAMQSAMEARRVRNEWLASVSESKNAVAALSSFVGGMTIPAVAEDLITPTLGPETSLIDLQRAADENRSDLRVADLSRKLSEDNLRLVKASRAMDITMNVGYTRSSEVRNEIAPAPRFNGVSAGVTIPLKFSSANRGEYSAAKTAVLQSDKLYEEAVIRVNVEVEQAYNAYVASLEIMNSYVGSIVEDAGKILENRMFGYGKGETGLLELLEAQRSYNEVMSSYIDARADFFRARVEVDRAVGL